MTEIKTIGIAFDPKKAVEGADEAKKAIKDFGDEAAKGLTKAENAAEKAGKEVKESGDKIEKSSKGAGDEISKLGKSRGFQEMAKNAVAGSGAARGGLMDLLDTFGLLDNRLGRVGRRALAGFSSLERFTREARQSASASGSLGADSARAAAGVADLGTAGMTAGKGLKFAGISGSAMATALSVALPIVLALSAAMAGIGAAVGVWKLFKAGLPKAADFEEAEIGMAVLLGGFDKADQKMKDLNEFANKTPFDTAGLVQGSRLLEVFTKGALNAEEGWTLVGDAAAAAQKPFEETARWVGRLYDGLQSGRPVGDATAALQEMGVLSGEARNQLEELQKSGADFATIWGVAETALKRFSGTMELQSMSWNGLISTIGDEWDSLLRGFSDPIMDSLKPVLMDLITLIQQLKPIAEQFGQILANGITFVVAILKSGEIEQTLKLGLAAAFEFGAAVFIAQMMLQVELLLMLLMTGLKNALIFPVQLFADLLSATIQFITKLILGDFSGAFEVVLNFFGEGGNAVISTMGAIAYNVLGQAFEDSVNVLRESFFKVWIDIQNAITTAAAQFGKMPEGNAPSMPERLDFFKPKKLDGFLGMGSAMDAANSMIGTNARDELKSFYDSFLGSADSLMPDLPSAATPSDGFSSLGSLGGGAGAGAGISKVKTPKASIKDLKDEKSAVESLTESWLDLEGQMDQMEASALQSISGGMTDAITGLVDGTKSAKEAFSDMTSSIVSDILRMIVQMQIQSVLASTLGGATGGGGFFGIAHSGGTVGKTNLSATSIPKFHSGGMASSEQAIKVEKGETILTRARARDIDLELRAAKGERQKAEGGQAITMMNITDRSEIADAVASNPDAVVNAISRSLPAVQKLVLRGK